MYVIDRGIMYNASLIVHKLHTNIGTYILLSECKVSSQCMNKNFLNLSHIHISCILMTLLTYVNAYYKIFSQHVTIQ